MARPIVIYNRKFIADFEQCQSPRLFDILLNFYEGDVFYDRTDITNAIKFQIVEHMESIGKKHKIDTDKHLHIVFHHSEGDPKYFGNIKQLEKYGCFLHSNYFLPQGKFFSYWQYDYLMSLKKFDFHLNSLNRFVPRFLCLNGRPDVHRYFVIQKLHDSDLFYKGLISFLNRYNQLDNDFAYREFKDLHCNDTKFVDEIYYNKKLLILDKSNSYIHEDDRSHDSYLYSDTSISLITETYADNRPGCFITEKSWKPIANMHFPIWIAQKGIVSAFRLMGIDVFDDIIDHSYDKQTNAVERWSKAIDSLAKALQLIENLDFQKRQKLHQRLLNNKNKVLNQKITQEEVESWV